MARTRQVIRASVRAWAAAVGWHHDTLAKKLAAAGIVLEGHAKPTAEQVFRVVVEDPAQARAAKAAVETRRLERKDAEERGELLRSDLVIETIARAFLPCRQALLGLPYEMAGRVGAEDPKEARLALTDWVDGTLARLRAGLPEQLLAAERYVEAEGLQDKAAAALVAAPAKAVRRPRKRKAAR